MRTKHVVLLALASVGLLALLACETGDTCDIRTSGIRVDFEAIEQDGATTARAQFMYKDTSLELGNCGDTIEVNGVRLNSVGNEYPITYEADVDANGDGEFVFVFEREGEGPFTSTATLPATFEITAPASGESFSRAEPINVAWSGDDWDFMTIAVEADDLWEYEETVADVNAYSIAENEIETHDGAEDDDINATLILSRSEEGDVDPIFDNGSSCVGKVIDEVEFVSTP